MSLGKDAADRIKQQQAEDQAKQAAAVERGIRTQENAESNWKRLIEALQREVAEFTEDLPRAKHQGLRADVRNSNNLTVETQVQPFFKMEVLRNYQGMPGVRAEITRQVGWDFDEPSFTPNYHFSENGFLSEEDEDEGTPEELAAALFGNVTAFFA
jgi:hypothetical protein